MNLLSDNSFNHSYSSYKALPRVDKKDHFDLQDLLSELDGEDIEMLQKSVKEPQFHKENKTLCMKIFPKLASKTNLTLEELQFYYDAKVTEIMHYDQNNKLHEVKSYNKTYRNA